MYTFKSSSCLETRTSSKEFKPFCHLWCGSKKFKLFGPFQPCRSSLPSSRARQHHQTDADGRVLCTLAIEAPALCSRRRRPRRCSLASGNRGSSGSSCPRRPCPPAVPAATMPPTPDALFGATCEVHIYEWGSAKEEAIRCHEEGGGMMCV